jgi:hypothetical protein
MSQQMQAEQATLEQHDRCMASHVAKPSHCLCNSSRCFHCMPVNNRIQGQTPHSTSIVHCTAPLVLRAAAVAGVLGKEQPGC